MRASFSPSWNFHGMQLRLLLVLVLGLTACDVLNLTFEEDASTDLRPDVTEDVVADVPEEELPPPCVYPSDPYAFNAVGDTVAPMFWSDAIARPDESGRPADLEDLFCDPDVHSIFIQVVTIICPLCPARMREIAYLRNHWREYGARWIFIISDAATPEAADAYTNEQGVSFGWSTNDEDNSEGPDTIAFSSFVTGVPWTGVISTSDMKIVYEATGSSLDIRAIATELASP